MLSAFHRAIARIRAMFQSGDLDRNLDVEIESHIRLRSEDYVSRGIRSGGIVGIKAANGTLCPATNSLVCAEC